MIARSGERALEWLARHVQEGELPTAVFGMASPDGIEVLEAFGSEDGRRVRVDDRFALFSITKPISALVAMRAVEKGLLRLTTPLRDALPAFGRGRSDVVQLRHLLSHTAGLVEPPLDAPALRSTLLSTPQLFEAGTMVHYSNLAFEGVSALVEFATGRTLEHGIADLALDLGLESLDFDGTDAHPVHGTRAAGFDYEAMKRTRHPAAGLHGTATDLLLLGSALLATELRADTRIVHPATLAAMRRPYTSGLSVLRPDPAASGQDYGLGWLMRHSAPDLLDRSLYGHGGWSGTQLWIYPELETCYVLMTNILDSHLRGVHLDSLQNAVTSGIHQPTSTPTPYDSVAIA